MEIHGNVFTVWSVWGTEYQSSVSSGDCPFRLHYLMDGNIAPIHTGRLNANTTKELHCGCTVSYHR